VPTQLGTLPVQGKEESKISKLYFGRSGNLANRGYEGIEFRQMKKLVFTAVFTNLKF